MTPPIDHVVRIPLFIVQYTYHIGVLLINQPTYHLSLVPRPPFDSSCLPELILLTFILVFYLHTVPIYFTYTLRSTVFHPDAQINSTAGDAWLPHRTHFLAKFQGRVSLVRQVTVEAEKWHDDHAHCDGQEPRENNNDVQYI